MLWMCHRGVRHHRSQPAGVHNLSASDYEGSHFVSGIFVAEVKTVVPSPTEIT